MPSSSPTASIVWFRRDLRTADNPALQAAIQRGPVLPVYIHAPDEEAPWQPGAASLWWLHHSLDALEKSLHAIGLPLIILNGESLDCLQQLIKNSNADAVFWNRLYEPACIKRDTRIKQQLRDEGIEAQSFNGALLLEPWQVENKQGKPFRVFTPFWRHCAGLLDTSPPELTPTPDNPQAVKYDGKRVTLPDLHLLPDIPWDKGFYKHWIPGENGAHEQLDQALDVIDDYDSGRDRVAEEATSRLSPHLHFGELSPRQIWVAVQQQAPGSESDASNRKAYLRQLVWREFAHHLLFHFPHTAEAPLNERFSAYPWWQTGQKDDGDYAANLQAWQRGETGIELVDAGMRQLWETGWMHNRTRMVVASLLTKNLGIHWREGARWFWDTLVDANLANNTMGWQWVAGSGADAAPFFRIFNPDTQAERFDPQGSYRQRWLPASHADIHPIVDIKESRKQALASYATVKNTE